MLAALQLEATDQAVMIRGKEDAVKPGVDDNFKGRWFYEGHRVSINQVNLFIVR